MQERAHWSVPLGVDGDKLEFIRDFKGFGEGRAGQRTLGGDLQEPILCKFSQPVVSAEVFLNGFNIKYTRGGDSELQHIRVDAWVVPPDVPPDLEFPSPDAGKFVRIMLMYILTDEDPTGDEDFNEAFIGFTVIAHTTPHPQ